VAAECGASDAIRRERALAAGENVEDDEAVDVERDVAAVDGRPREVEEDLEGDLAG